MLPASDKSSARCTAEHLRARCDGGKDVPENVVAACWLCNKRRYRRKVPPAPEDYRKLVRKRLSKLGRFRVHNNAMNSAPRVSLAQPNKRVSVAICPAGTSLCRSLLRPAAALSLLLRWLARFSD
ncbi:HNH endonuclease [Devosia sediminis]